MTDKLKFFYMNIAAEVAKLSYCKRKQVGAVIVSSNGKNIQSFGYNGQPSGFPNCCEDSNGITLSTTIHAELNAIAKCAELGHSTAGATMFVTLSPCINCALLILQSGITTIYYRDAYKCPSGLELLTSNGIRVIHLKD